MIHIVLPAFNEEKTIGPLCETMAFVMKENGLPYKVIIVDDGSSDSTAKAVRSFTKKMPVVLVRHKVNRGLSEAIKTGLLTALKRAKSEDIIVTMDSDNTHTPGLILRMTRMIREGNDVVIASRYLSGSRVRGVPFFREVLSLGGSILFRILFPIKGVRDYTCGYRAYRAKILTEAFDYYGEEFVNRPGFSCMVDILLKLRHLDVIVSEVPLILRYDLKESLSKMKIGKTIKETLALIVERKLGR
ncbi:hypothetical protein A2115_01485 [Candidatus Woesebacteria bacterium GWA1_41_8]|uniref:Glycosyltransferase 2-like domain-containing protein n=1 Tax=Candidatus Woesebacteria bacterium GWA1_41_8 TaxID=1802471 RepID=A0A1F7WJF3_9BACT|nr:MAG: hypothetical protein A2115_01485 [Candidatus Woesebacteria bacterium GWA1_41_8]